MRPGFCLFLLFLQITMVSVSEARTDHRGPPTQDGPVMVDAGFYLSSVNAISEEDETFEFEGMLSLHWKDSRQAFDPEITGYDEKFFQGAFQFTEVFDGWWPQLYLVNEAGRFERQGTTLRITADGDLYLSEEIDAIAKSRMDLRRFPFDQQKFTAVFEILAANSADVVLRVDPATTGIWQEEHHEVHVPQWQTPSFFANVLEYESRFNDGHISESAAFTVGIDIKRNPSYMLRLVMLPVMIFVFLSWSVFWMDRSSLGERMDISFIGILTVVAYQIISTEHMPKISYMTILLAFMTISFLTMCASIVVNLRVASHDQNGRADLGDSLDKRSRILFPLAYISCSILTMLFMYLTD